MNDYALELYKRKLVEVMASFEEFCKNNSLQYYACSGTAIGAIRHKGFIPWDDDIDVYMPRPDYNRLMAIRGNLQGTGYAIKNIGDDEYVYAFAKYYDDRTTLVEMEYFPKCVLGVYIDIFPLDEVAGTFEDIVKKKNNYTLEYRHFQNTFLSITPKIILSALFHRQFEKFFELLSLLVMSQKKKEKIRKRFANIEKKWSEEHGDMVMTHTCIYSLRKELFPKQWFRDFIYADFEDIQIRLSKENDRYLTQLFGDYMTPPPESKRVSEHSHYYLNLKEKLNLDQIKDRIQQGEHLVY